MFTEPHWGQAASRLMGLCFCRLVLKGFYCFTILRLGHLIRMGVFRVWFLRVDSARLNHSRYWDILTFTRSVRFDSVFMTPFLILVVLALLFAVLSIPFSQYPLLAVSVILLSVALLIRSP